MSTGHVRLKRKLTFYFVVNYRQLREGKSRTMVSITLSIPAAILIAAGGSVWIYQDATKREMSTADMWAVGFFVGFFILPILGGILVLVYYFQKRQPRYPSPTATPP